MPTSERPTSSRLVAIAGVTFAGVVVAAIAGCGSDGAPVAQSTPTPTATAESTPSAAPTPTRSPSTSPRPQKKASSPTSRTTATKSAAPRSTLPAYRYSISRVTAADLPNSWREGCPVPPSDLRQMSLTYYGFDGKAHTGTLVVHESVTSQIAAVFKRLYADRFPIRRMVKVDAYGGDDDASMAADNTSAFNCRAAVGSDPPRWSMHAYGKAIDVNPVENPYVYDGKVEPPNGAKYADRSRNDPGMAKSGNTLVRSFAAYGWEWGGNWSSSKDYQHFSTNGQ